MEKYPNIKQAYQDLLTEGQLEELLGKLNRTPVTDNVIFMQFGLGPLNNIRIDDQNVVQTILDAITAFAEKQFVETTIRLDNAERRITYE